MDSQVDQDRQGLKDHPDHKEYEETPDIQGVLAPQDLLESPDLWVQLVPRVRQGPREVLDSKDPQVSLELRDHLGPQDQLDLPDPLEG